MMKDKILILMNEIIELYKKKSGKAKLYYISEHADWVIKSIGYDIIKQLQQICGSVCMSPRFLNSSLIHFGCIGSYLTEKGPRYPNNPTNKIVVTWFHVNQNDARNQMAGIVDRHVDLWHTSCTITREKMIKLGIPQEKIVLIPLGIDCHRFHIPSKEEKINFRRHLNIDDDYIVIGSFQKDGNGWEEGLSPKEVKGPDIFCDTVERLSKVYKIFVLLTGPSRGYVKNRLKKMRVPYYHKYLRDPLEVSEYYKALDLYIVSAREEGGPKAVLESLAAGVPLVSTKVGMAIDVIEDGVNGYLADIEDVYGLAEKASYLIDNPELCKNIITAGRETALQYDWSIIAQKYYDQLYRPLLNKL